MSNDSARDPMLGQTLGGYRLEALLGKGGMARVYWGVEARSRRTAAIKVMRTSQETDSDYKSRFEREARAVSMLNHPNIVKLYDYGQSGDAIYMAMQYVQGADLGSILARHRAQRVHVNQDDAVRIVGEISGALDYAHSQGIIHRDIKPGNILISQEGHATLTDFGLALHMDMGTRGEVFGTPYYIAPEQAISSAGAVPQSDQYSLAIILYEMLTGQVPFDAGNPMDTAILHITQEPRAPREIAPEISQEVQSVILRSLAKKPEDRFASCSEMAQALAKAAQLPLLAAQSVGTHQAFNKFIERAAVSLPTLPARTDVPSQPAGSRPGTPVQSKEKPIRAANLTLFGIALLVCFFFAVVLSIVAVWWVTR